MELFRAKPGHKLVDTDFTALEPKVLAYFSRDPTMIELYASGKLHDIYLYVAMFLFPDKQAAIAEVYRPDAPTKESIAACKAQFKRERGIAKPVVLGAGYGAGAWKIWQTLKLSGIKVSEAEAAEIHKRYWQLFSGIKSFERQLRAEREDRGGWILNGIGRPLAIPDHRVKDLVNAFVQSTGHDCLLKLIYYIKQLRDARGVPMVPWIVDMHDQTTWEVPEAAVPDAVQIFKDAYGLLNEELKADIPLSGNVDVADNLWQLKEG
jgi:DNA polymerase I-like protein with 3'-5' exonuclease and polymerase domains